MEEVIVVVAVDEKRGRRGGRRAVLVYSNCCSHPFGNIEDKAVTMNNIITALRARRSKARVYRRFVNLQFGSVINLFLDGP